MNIIARFQSASREMKLFVLATFTIGVAASMVDSIFNNFLNERFSLSGFQRSFLEFPRELPGFLVVFIAALVWFLSNRRLATFTILLEAVALVFMAFMGV